MCLCISTRDSCCHFPLPGATEKLCDLSSVQSPRIVVHLCDTHHCRVDVLSHSEITHEKKLIKVFTPTYGDETGTVEVWLPANTEKLGQRKQMLHTQPRHVFRVMLVQGDAPKKAASVSHHARQCQRKRNLHRPVFSLVSTSTTLWSVQMEAVFVFDVRWSVCRNSWATRVQHDRSTG